MTFSNIVCKFPRLLANIIGGLIILLIVISLIPVPQDELPPPDKYGAGALAGLQATTGLAREFPQQYTPIDNPSLKKKSI